jgi:hypothetical protein
MPEKDQSEEKVPFPAGFPKPHVKRILAKMKEDVPCAAPRSPGTADGSKRVAGLSKAARRKVRQAVALAVELELQSITLYGVVWRIQERVHREVQQKPLGREQPSGTKTKAAPSPSRQKRDAERRARHAELMERVRIFRMRSAFNTLRKPEAAMEAKEQPPPPGGWQLMDTADVLRKEARPRPSPAPAESPTGERQPKRVQRALYPPGPTHPPPSPPPSPPQSPGRGPAHAGAGRGSPKTASDRAERCEGANGRAPIYPWAFWTSAVKIQSAYRRVSAMQVASTLRRWQMEDSYVWSDSSDEEEGW